MTLVEFYVVTRMTKASVWLRPINCIVTNDDGRGEGRAMPDTSWQASDSKVFRKRIQVSDGKQYVLDMSKYFCNNSAMQRSNVKRLTTCTQCKRGISVLMH